MKTNKQLFFAKGDDASIEKMNKLFMVEGKYFIERMEDGKWVEDYHPVVKLFPGMRMEDGIKLTNDPSKAMNLKTKGKAMTFCIQFGFTENLGWKIIEYTK